MLGGKKTISDLLTFKFLHLSRLRDLNTAREKSICLAQMKLILIQQLSQCCLNIPKQEDLSHLQVEIESFPGVMRKLIPTAPIMAP